MGVEGSAAFRPHFNGFNTMRGGHFRLITLGRLALERSDGLPDEQLATLTVRRRKLALLAVLALARRAVSRDVLVEMFWGDQDETRARHSLSDAVSHIRRVLGRESIVATRSEVALGPRAPLVIDAVELAADARVDEAGGDDAVLRDERTLALYGGPFLAGVHLEGSTSFEQWVDRERVRLERLFVRAAKLRCEALARSGAWVACQQVAERWLDAEPLSAEAAVTYLESLSSGANDDGRALAAYERLCSRLRREYELEPDARVAAVAAWLAARRRELATRPAGGPPPTSESDAKSSTVHHQTNAPTTTTPHAVPIRYPRPHVAVGLLTVVLVAAAFVAGASRAIATTGMPRSSTVVAIAAIEPVGADTNLAWLADGLPQMIAAKLSRSTDIEVVSPAQMRAVRLRADQARQPLPASELLDLGRRVGANVIVSGGISRAGRQAILDLEVRTLPDGRVRRIDVAVNDDIIALVDQAAVQLLDAVGSAGSGPSLADVETPSIAAYQHFTRYAQNASEGRMSVALPELDAAIAIDKRGTRVADRDRLVSWASCWRSIR